MTADTNQKTPGGQFPRNTLRNRYVFHGTLRMLTGLHVGGGKATLSHTNSPVVLTPEGLPFIPGSSLKGVLRSTIEKFIASLPIDLGLRSCGLILEDEKESNGSGEFASNDQTAPEMGQTEKEENGRQNKICPTTRQNWITAQRRKMGGEAAQAFIERERENLCHTCLLFGSPFAAGRIKVNDLYLIDDTWSGTTQIRDGVAIDRDKETARSGAKYDFEVVPSSTAFAMHILIENATPQDLQLISIGLSEFTNGFASIGGLRSRGLGACILDDLGVRSLELSKLDDTERKKRLLRYLLRNKESREDGLDLVDYQAFIEEHINTLFGEISANS